jgi:formiminotetrahydrofolate cyclodeaminase
VEDPAAGATPFRDLTLGEFVDRLASAQPVPGGGSAAAVTASLGAALVQMVAALSVGRPRFAEHTAALEAAALTGERLRARFLALADEDAGAFAAYATALRLPRETEDERAARDAAVSAAARHATAIPFSCIEACLELAVAAESIAGRSNPNASSDLTVAALLADAAARAAEANVMINLPATKDPVWADRTRARVAELLGAIGDRVQSTRDVVASGERRSPRQPAEVR